MAQHTPFESFPSVSSGHQYVSPNGGTRPRRKSSGLGGEPRGDTAAPALATLSDRSPTSPTAESPMMTTGSQPVRGRKRRKAKSLLRRWKAISLRHTWLTPLILCSVIAFGYLLNPSPSNPLHAALFLSYPIPGLVNEYGAQMYDKGGKDFAFVAFYIVFLSFTREFIMQRLLRPWASYLGIKSRAKQSRFMEQAYTAIYFAVFGPYGLYVMSRTPIWYFNTEAFYEGFPHKEHEALFKAYYLLQASYWAQQMIVLLLMLEKPRKDFKELVAHHLITVSLIWLSYRFHFTYIGLAVYITHDISDFFLATSKCLNYVDSIIVGPYFFCFIFIWTYLRHYLNLTFLYSMVPRLAIPLPAAAASFLQSYNVSLPDDSLVIKSTASQFASIGPYDVNWETQQYKCYISHPITFFLLSALQSVNLFWLYFIFRIAWRFVTRFEAVDERSEYGSDKEEEEQRKEFVKEEKAKERQANGGPAVLLNGKPVEAADGVKERKKER